MADTSEAAAQIEVLDQNLKKTHVLSSRMTGILTHFDGRLNRLEKTILPLHNSTQSLTRLGANIDLTLAALASVRVQQEKAQDDEAALMSSPNPANLGPYMATLDRTIGHLRDLQASGSRNAEGGAKETTRLAEIGYKKLCHVLVQLIQDGSTTPLDIETFFRDKLLPPSSTLPTHSLLLSSHLPSYLLQSPLASQNASQLEGALKQWGATRASWVKKGVEVLGRRVMDRAGSGNDTGGKLVEGILAIAESELSLILSLLPPISSSSPLPSSQPPHSLILSSILSPTLSYLSQSILTPLLASLKQDAQPWSAYILLSQLSSLLPRWDDFFSSSGLSSSDSSTLSTFVTKDLRSFCTRSLPEGVLKAGVPTTGMRPDDGMRVGLMRETKEAVGYLLTLPTYAGTVEELAMAIGDRKWLMGAAGISGPNNADKGDGGGVLEHYVCDVASALLTSLEQRARQMRKGAGGIFLINNVSYVRENIMLSNKSDIMDLLGDAGEDMLNKAWRSAKASYLTPITEALSLISPSGPPADQAALLLPSPHAPTTTRLNPLKNTTEEKDRQTTKDCFTRFWQLLDGIERVHVQEGCKIESGETRGRLEEEVRGLVKRAYVASVTKFGGSVGPKYIRMTPDDLDKRVKVWYNSR